MNFKVGEEVLCIRGRESVYAPPVRYGEEYTVKDVCHCRKCGAQLIDVGFISPNVFANGYENSKQSDCHLCGTAFPKDNIWWASSTRFAPKVEMSAAIAELMKEKITIEK